MSFIRYFKYILVGILVIIILLIGLFVYKSFDAKIFDKQEINSITYQQAKKHLTLNLPAPTPFENSHTNFEKNYDYPPIPQISGTVRVPVLTYHHVAPLPRSGSARDYFVSPEMFEKQMEYLKNKNYKTLSMQEFYDLVKSGINPSQKSVLITLDDSNSNNYTYAYPILKKYGFVATFFIISARSGINKSQLIEMSNNGMDIESHSRSHPDLVKLTDSTQLVQEIAGSRQAINSLSNSSVIAISYPGCVANSTTLGYVRSAGYLLGFTCGKKIDHKFNSRLVIQRVHVYSNLENFKERLSGICNYTAVYE